MRALKAGARAYLLKNTLSKELLNTIRAVHAGRKSLSRKSPLNSLSTLRKSPCPPLKCACWRLIAEGNTNKEIANVLSVTEDAVKGQVKNILSKLGADDRTEAAMIGVKRGIIEL